MGHRLFKAPNGVRRLGEIRHGNCGRFLFLLPTFGETNDCFGSSQREDGRFDGSL